VRTDPHFLVGKDATGDEDHRKRLKHDDEDKEEEEE
jgi:hypothetical protein